MRLFRSLGVVLGGVVAGLACRQPTTATSGAKSPASSTSAVTPAVPPPKSPSRWQLASSGDTVALTAKLPLGDGRVVWAGRGGERWLEPAGGGTPQAATELLPEDVTAIVRDGASIVFVGGSGTAYLTTEPLGLVTSLRAPSERLHSVVGSERAIVGLAADGTVRRSVDAGVSWQKVPLPPIVGLAMHAAMLPGGEGAILFGPQRVVVTVDHGATWTLLATPGVGARHLAADENGEIILEGAEASGVLRTNPLRFERIQRPAARSLELVVGGGGGHRTQHARAALEGRGLFVGARWDELVVDHEPAVPTERSWWLSRGEIGAAPRITAVAELAGCARVVLGANATTRIVGCVVDEVNGGTGTGSGSQPPRPPFLKLFRSDDDGNTFRADGVVSIQSEDPRLFVGPSGLLLVSGGCKSSPLHPWSCRMSAPVVRPPTGDKFAKCNDDVEAHFFSVAFDEKKNRAYAVGYSNGHAAFFVSKDGGASFTTKSLSTVRGAPGEDDLFTPNPYGFSSVAVSGDAIVVATSTYATQAINERVVVLRSDDEGVHFTAHRAPAGAAAIGVGGGHAFAYSASMAKGWESSDGGATWSSVSAPAAADYNVQSSVVVVCSSYGCQVSTRATRIGWDDVSPAATGLKPPKVAKVAALSALDCHASGTSSALGIGTLPDAGDSDLGNGARFVLPRREYDGGAVVYVGERVEVGVGASKKSSVVVREHRLFGPAPPDTAVVVANQLEGAIALRYAFHRDSPSGTSSSPITAGQLVDVEVAWYRAETGKVSRAKIAGVGPLRAGDVDDGGNRPSVAHQGLLSMAIGGSHVRPLASAGPGDPLFWVTDAGKIERMTFPDFPKVDVAGRKIDPHVDGVRVGDRSLLFVVDDTGTQLLSAWSKKTGGWESRTWSFWPEHDRGLLYLRNFDSGPAPGWSAHFVDDGEPPRWASVGFLTTFATPTAEPPEPVRIPVTADLGDVPRACDKAHFGATRFRVPSARGLRHPIFVDVQGTQLVFATDEAVVRYKDASDWCVSGWDTIPITEAPANAKHAVLVHLDDLDHASLFERSGVELSVTPMQCTWAKDKLPDHAEKMDAFRLE